MAALRGEFPYHYWLGEEVGEFANKVIHLQGLSGKCQCWMRYQVPGRLFITIVHPASTFQIEITGTAAVDFAILAAPISVLNLSTRATVRLLNIGIQIVGQLVMEKEDRFIRVKGLGLKSLNEIKQALAEFDLSLNTVLPEETIKRLGISRR